MRKAFWEHANELSDLGAEVSRIQQLLSDEFHEPRFQTPTFSLEKYIDQLFFPEWAVKHHITYLSISDTITAIGLGNIAKQIRENQKFMISLDDFLLYIEFIYNIVKTVTAITITGDNEHTKARDVSLQIQRNIGIDCARLNFEIKADADDKYIIVEKNAAATAVADQYISIDKDFSFKVIEYNHFLLRGNLARKKEILITLGEKFEPLRQKLKSGSYSQVAKDAGFLVNNLNLRHNNVTPGTNGNYHAFVAGMSAGDLEEWYDKTYDALLFALQADNYIDLSKKVGTLIEQIKAADKPTP